MWKKIFGRKTELANYRLDKFKELLKYITQLANYKLGYPVSLLTYFGTIDNQKFGIKRRSIANILLNNVGDPFKDSETSLLEVKRHEREIIHILETYFGLANDQIRGYVTSGGTEGNFAALWWSKRYLINSAMEKILEVDSQIKLKLKEEQELHALITKIEYTHHEERIKQLEKIIKIKDDINTKKEILQQLLTPTVLYTKDHTHYSIPKIAEILHLNIKLVAANTDGSMNLNDLHKEILIHIAAHPHSPIIVIGNIGTTITGVIDDVPGIKQIITNFKPAVNHTIHLDGALAGFVIPILKPFGEVENYFDGIGANTIAFSAHKYLGLPQPCGIVLANRDFFEKAFKKNERSIEYVGNILDYTVTGSRSGLNVLMFYNALCTVGANTPEKGAIKKIIKENLKNAQYIYEQLKKVFGDDKVTYTKYFNISFPKPSMSIAKKYQLMLSGDKATVCILPNVHTQLIDEFIKDIKYDKEKAVMSIQSQCKIVKLEAPHESAAIDIFIKCFCGSEPLTRHLNISSKEYEPFARAVVQKAIAEELSKVALDEKGRVVACAIAEDMAAPFIPDLNKYPKLEPIVILLDELSKPFIKDRVFIKGKILHIWIAAVDETYRGRGLSTEIDMACVTSAAKNGFHFAYAEFTNAISEKVTKQFQILHLCNKIEFSRFNLNGQFPFKDLNGAAISYVASLKPGIGLESLSKCYKTTQASPIKET